MSDLLNSASLVMIPSGYKEDVVYSQIPTDGSGDLSFTRASNGTRINSAGLVEVTPWNLLEDTNTFSSWNLEGGTLTSGFTAPDGSSTAYKYVQIPGGGLYSGNYGVTADVKFAQVWLKSVSGGSITVNLSDGAAFFGTFNVTGEWQLFTAPFTANTRIGFYLYAISNAQGIYVWHPQLNIGSTAKPYFPTTDRLNVPRLTYQNGGGGCPSLLLEKQSTNLVLHSEQFDATASWSYSECSVTANQTISPDGTQNADKLVENSANTIHEIYQGLTLTSGTAYTNTIYAKSAERTQIAINFVSGGFGQGSQVIANLSTGTLGTITNYGGVTGSTATITNVGNGWYRISLTMTPVSTTTFYADYSPAVNGNAFYQGNGTSGIYIWGAQIEASSYPTSYIPTTTSSATRVADACFKTGISSLIGQTEGTIFVDFVVVGIGSNNINIYNNDRTANTISTNAILFKPIGSIECQTFLGNGTFNTISITASTYTVGQRIKLAYRYKSGDFALYINGIQKATATNTMTFVGTKSQIYLDDNAVVYAYQESVQYNNFIQFPTALTNAELASLTTI